MAHQSPKASLGLIVRLYKAFFIFFFRDPTLSHLFYADDVIITTDWNPHDIDNIIQVLHVFHLASGLKINIYKFNIFGIGVTTDEISSMASRTGCAAGCFPFTYLGLPIGANMNLTSSWQILINRFQKRLSSWKANLLSISGRLTLIKAVLDSFGVVLKILRIWHWLNGLNGVGGCFHLRTICGFLLSRRYIVKRVAWIFRVVALTAPGLGLLVLLTFCTRKWQWNWSRTDIGTRNTAYLNDLLLEISQIDISVDEDTYRLPHRLNLSSRGLDIPTISCSSCSGNVESADHVFFECDLVKEIWSLVRKWCDIYFPTFASFDTWNSWFCIWQPAKVKSRRLYVIFAALFWWIWRYHNSVTFSSDSIKKGDLFDNIRASSFSWISNWGHVSCNWVEWLKNPLLIAGS
ncbi:putative RNA-directed DNA polymerase, eukaryota, reverse transcriptase zinc-binding domain protein [Tanacetum coccineum]